MTQIASQPKNLWWWIPSLYFGQGIPYVVVMSLSVIFYKRMDISNTDIALYTSWMYLPWVIKPLWSPLVDMFRTKRFWIVAMQWAIGSALALVALSIPVPHFFQLTLAVFWLVAFSSATHDIAADGFYMLALKEHEQASFVGVRSTFYRIAMIAGQGGLVFVAGWFEQATGNKPLAWSIVFFTLAALFLVLGIYHRLVLPHPAADTDRPQHEDPFRQFFAVFAAFLKKKDIASLLAFLLLYRFGEAQLLKMAAPFLLDGLDQGGLGLSTQTVGILYGTVGVICLTVGGLLGGYAISRQGLKRWLWVMALSLNVPHLAYVYLALVQPQDVLVIGVAVAVEQFGYGFGFAAYLLYMIMVCGRPGPGEPADASVDANKTAHYAICTGFMALGMMLPGMFSGWLQTRIGYGSFFIWVCVCALPALVATFCVKVDPGFGRKSPQAQPKTTGPDKS